MQLRFAAILLLALPGTGLFATDASYASIAEVQDHMISQLEREVVPLAQAMPADKYDFAPTQGTFEGVRTFGQQMSHIAAVIHEFSAGLLGEKGYDAGEKENGPANLKDKDAIVAYLKDGFAQAHKAVQTLNDQNFTQKVVLPFAKMTRGQMAELMAWHTYDHYGQAVVYARMNGVVPPASR